MPTPAPRLRRYCQSGENAGKPGPCPEFQQRKQGLLQRAGKPGAAASTAIRKGKIAEHRLKQAIQKHVPPKLQKAAGYAVQAVFSSWIPAQKAAYAIAREVGGERHAKKVSRALIAADLLGAKTAAPAIGALAGPAAGTTAYMLPLASSAYVAFSIVRHPVATFNAARKAIAGVKSVAGSLAGKLTRKRPQASVAHAEGKRYDPATIKALLKGYEQAGEHGDWYEALLFAALPETKGDLAEAAALAGKTLASSKPPALETFSEGNRRQLHNVEIFQTGKHRGKEYTRQDLDDIVRNFDEYSVGKKALVRVPTVLGHEEKQAFLERSDLPSLAWPDRIHHDGKTLYADYDDIAPKVRRLLKNKAYRTVSSEIYDEPPEGIPPSAKGKMLRRIAFLGGDIPQIKTIDEILSATDHAEGPPSRFAHYTPCHLKLASVSAAPLAGAYVCFSEVLPMNREEMLKRLQELGYDTSVFTDTTPDEALAEILRVMTDDHEDEDEEGGDDKPPVEEEDEADGDGESMGHEDYDDPTAEGHPSNEVDDLELHDEDEEESRHDDYDDEPPEPKDDEDKAMLAEHFRKMKGYAERGLKKYCSEEEAKPMGKFSEQKLAVLVRREVQAALEGSVSREVKSLQKFRETALKADKRRAVKAFLAEQVKAGKVLPCELDRSDPANLFSELMRASTTVVHKFTENGKAKKASDFDLKMRAIRNRPARTFAERLRTSTGGKAGAIDSDGEQIVSAHFERFSEDFKKNGISREQLLADYKALNADNKAAMLAEYRRLAQTQA